MIAPVRRVLAVDPDIRNFAVSKFDRLFVVRFSTRYALPQYKPRTLLEELCWGKDTSVSSIIKWPGVRTDKSRVSDDKEVRGLEFNHTLRFVLVSYTIHHITAFPTINFGSNDALYFKL